MVGYIFIGYIVSGLIFGLITSYLAQEKNYDGGFWWGFFLGIIGLMVVGFRPNRTHEERVSHEPHVFYCPGCGRTFAGSEGSGTKCPACGAEVVETMILVEEWKERTASERDRLKQEIAQGKHIRQSGAPAAETPKAAVYSDADELLKYARLLEMGAITKEEYEAKKKQILNL